MSIDPSNRTQSTIAQPLTTFNDQLIQSIVQASKQLDMTMQLLMQNKAKETIGTSRSIQQSIHMFEQHHQYAYSIQHSTPFIERF